MATKRVVKKAVKKAPTKKTVVPEAKYHIIIMARHDDFIHDCYCSDDATLLEDVKTFLEENDCTEALVYRLVPYKKYVYGGVKEVFD